MAAKNRPSGGFITEMLVPSFLFFWFAPYFMNDVWLSVKADPASDWFTYAQMYALTISIGVCWMQFYNCVRLGLFPPKRRR